MECYTPSDLEAAIAADNFPVLMGDGEFDLTAVKKVAVRGSPRLWVRGSSQPQVVARESSQPHVVARESSQPHVVARGYTQLSVHGRVCVDASPNTAVLIHGNTAEVTGGHQTRFDISTPEKWCDYYGLPVREGVVTLFKAVHENFQSPYGGDYTPGTTPCAPDWDGGEKECSGGLHFSPHPLMALVFDPEATRFVACPVALAEIVVHPDSDHPEKVKATGCAGPVWEVDRMGHRIDEGCLLDGGEPVAQL